ncbi:MAG: CbiX/SirB N-terminal domain-containing protein [Gemmatimonadaceae bacterium]
MKGILIVDHGSVKAEANDMLRCMSNLVQMMAGPQVVVRYAHMELAAPDIARGFADCVEAGATEVTVFPYMLSPGKHSTRDIPRLVAQSAKPFGHVTFNVTPAFGVHEKLAELVLDRAGVEPVKAFAGSEADRCWDPDCSETLCGDACRARTARQTALPGGTT